MVSLASTTREFAGTFSETPDQIAHARHTVA
jgi:hypothetical protein